MVVSEQDWSTSSTATRSVFQKVAGDVIADRIEAIALQLRGIEEPQVSLFEGEEALEVLVCALQQALRKIDEIFELEGFSAGLACRLVLELFHRRVRGGLASVSSLSEVLSCSPAVISRRIDVLEQMQLVERLGYSAEEFMVVLTEKGYDRAKQALHLLL
jgi:DNA-binding MarR family transcriptional regulator